MPLVSGVSVCACSRMLPATLTAIFTTYIAVVNMGADTAVTHVQPHQTVVPNARGLCTAHLNTVFSADMRFIPETQQPQNEGQAKLGHKHNRRNNNPHNLTIC